MVSSEPSAEKALDLMEGALRILDDCGAPAVIGAHLDLAIATLCDLFDIPPDDRPHIQI